MVHCGRSDTREEDTVYIQLITCVLLCGRLGHAQQRALRSIDGAH